MSSRRPNEGSEVDYTIFMDPSLLEQILFPFREKTPDGYVVVHVQGCWLDGAIPTPRAGYGVWFGENDRR
jgi:hypothetical protein